MGGLILRVVCEGWEARRLHSQRKESLLLGLALRLILFPTGCRRSGFPPLPRTQGWGTPSRNDAEKKQGKGGPPSRMPPAMK